MTEGPRYYVYLVSSLPMLLFGTKPPFSFERFIAICRGLIPKEDLELLKTINLRGEDFMPISQPTLERWHAFDMALRNELVKIRAAHRKTDPFKYLRQDGYADIYLSHIAINAYRNPSPLEGERMLDYERWRFLDELSTGHYFDLDILIIYTLKLLILEKWDRINSADAATLREEVLERRG